MNINERIDQLLGELYEPLVHEDGTFRAPVKQLLTDVLNEVKPKRYELDDTHRVLGYRRFNEAVTEMEAKQRQLGL